MPKRTDPIQRLVKRIYESLAPVGAKITESPELPEGRRRRVREIDLLIEHELFDGALIRLAVEVRDRRRKETVQWIDELVGKYKDMKIHKVFAVSTSGFTRAAVEKAQDEDIETLTLDDAEALEWPTQFLRVGAARVERTDVVTAFELETDPPLVDLIDLDSPVSSESKTFTTLQRFVALAFSRVRASIGPSLVGKLTLADLKSGSAAISIPIQPANRTFVQTGEGTKSLVKMLTLRVHCRFTVNDLSVSHRLLGDRPLALASVATVDDQEGRAIEMTVVQVASAKNSARVFIDSTNKPATKRREKKPQSDAP